MWETYYEEPFILPPKHAALFCLAAACLSDDMGWESYEDIDDATGIAVFDRLTQGQKQTAILEVSRALLCPEVEPPLITAALAATVDAIYRRFLVSIDLELAENDGRTTCRAMLLSALAESNYWEDLKSGLEPGEEPEQPPAADAQDFDIWEYLVDDLQTVTLEDYDFEMEEKFLDLPPDKADQLKKSMNIDHDYFTTNPADPTPSQLEALRRELRTVLADAYR